jgi:hypothetical protein
MNSDYEMTISVVTAEDVEENLLASDSKHLKLSRSSSPVHCAIPFGYSADRREVDGRFFGQRGSSSRSQANSRETWRLVLVG